MSAKSDPLRAMYPNLTSEQLDQLRLRAQIYKLDPIVGQIYGVKYGQQFAVLLSIDGMRVLAARSGLYAGSDAAVYTVADGDVFATVIVYKIVHGIRCAFGATCALSEFLVKPPSGRPGPWQTKPRHMLGIRAEFHALRKAFPGIDDLDDSDDPASIEAAVQVEQVEQDITYPDWVQSDASAEELARLAVVSWCDAEHVDMQIISQYRKTKNIQTWSAMADALQDNDVSAKIRAAQSRQTLIRLMPDISVQAIDRYIQSSSIGYDNLLSAARQDLPHTIASISQTEVLV